MKALECSQYFSHCEYGDSSRPSRAANSAAQDPRNLNSYKLLIMIVLVTCKNEEDPIRNEGARVLILYINFSNHEMLKGS